MAAGWAAALVVVVGSRHPLTRDVVLLGAGAVTPWVTLAAVRWYRPPHPGAWRLVALSELLWGAGLALDPGSSTPVPALGVTLNELCTLLAYGACVAALWLFVSSASTGRRLLTSVDAVALAVALAAVVWAVARAAARDGRLGVGIVPSVLYPSADVLVAVAVVRVASRASFRRPSYLLATAGATVLLVTDLVNISFTGPGAVEAVQVLQTLSLALLGLAAVHPSMATVTVDAPARAHETSHVQLAVLAVALLTPAVLICAYGPDVDVLTAAGLAVSCLVALTLVMVRLTAMVRVIEAQGTQLASQARSDHLTGLPNRRTVDAELGRTVVEAAQHDEPLAVALLDLDRFKDFNDTRGHDAGDRLLSAVASAWRATLPAEVFLGRHGGEEFLVVCRGRDATGLAELVEGLRAVMPPGRSFSAGIAQWDGLEHPLVLVARADRALYAAKAAGRDCTWVTPVPGVAPRAVPRGRPTLTACD